MRSSIKPELSLDGAGEMSAELATGLNLVPESFYADHPERVARALLGKVLLRRIHGQELRGRIVEVEAYLGEEDPAAHAFAGRTLRNSVLFGPPGRAYIYFIYGMHYCLNVSCEPDGQAGSVLIRALEPLAGLEEMARLRTLPHGAAPRLLASGPGRLCQAFAITRKEHNGVDLTSPRSNLQIVDDGFGAQAISTTPRIGIRKAAGLLLRFYLEGNRFVSASLAGNASSSG